MACLGQSVFQKGVKGFLSLGNSQRSLGHQLHAQDTEEGLQLHELALIMRCENDAHADRPHSASARACSARRA